jgi:hypothetical protein
MIETGLDTRLQQQFLQPLREAGVTRRRVTIISGASEAVIETTGSSQCALITTIASGLAMLAGQAFRKRVSPACAGSPISGNGPPPCGINNETALSFMTRTGF